MKNIKQINYWVLGGLGGEKPIMDALQDAAKMGVDGIELAFGAGSFKQGISEKKCKEIRSAARKLGLKMETVATGFYWGCSLSSNRDSERKRAIKFTKEYLQVANWIGAKTILVVPGAVAVPFDPSRPVVPYEDAWKNATKSIKMCLATAEKLKVNIAFENVWNWFLADPYAMKSFIDQFKSSRVGCYFDVGNCAINGYPEHWITMLGKKRIKAIHVKNFKRDDCGGGLSGFGDNLEKGAVDHKEVAKALKKIKYTGPITAEMIPFSRLPDLVLPDMSLAKSTVKKLMQLY